MKVVSEIYNIVLVCPIKNSLFLTLAVHVYLDLCWVQTDRSVNKTRCPVSFWSSEVHLQNWQTWFQSPLDACVTTRTGPSIDPEMADLFRRMSTPFCALTWCMPSPSWTGTTWRPLSGMTRAQTGPRACKSSPETAAVVVTLYTQLYVDKLSITWQGGARGITRFVVVVVVVVVADIIFIIPPT